MLQFSNSIVAAVASHSEAKETDTFSKNGASSKSQTSRENFFKMIFFTALMASAVFSGCGKKDVPPEEADEMVTVGMKSVGELIGTETPLTKSDVNGSEKPLWGLQVYLVPEQGQGFDPLSTTKVAHGVFDDISKITLTLNKKRKYCIEATYMPNGQNEIYWNGIYEDWWGRPVSNAGLTPINQVIYSSNVGFRYLGNGNHHLVAGAPGGSGNYTETDRYYGFVEEYTPVEGSTIEIDMKRTVFGLTFVGVNTDGFAYDNLVVRLNANGNIPRVYTLNVDNSQPTSQLVIPMICILEVRRSALENNYVETIKVSIGIEENPALIFFGDVNVKRNTMHTYTFKMEADDTDNGVKPIFDDGEMENETKELK